MSTIHPVASKIRIKSKLHILIPRNLKWSTILDQVPHTHSSWLVRLFCLIRVLLEEPSLCLSMIQFPMKKEMLKLKKNMCIFPMLWRTKICITSNGPNWDLILPSLLSINLTSLKVFLIKLLRLNRNILKNWHSSKKQKEKLWNKLKLKSKVPQRNLKMQKRKTTNLESKPPKLILTMQTRERKKKKLNI